MKSPFKFLDSYTVDDYPIFFGRNRETEALYDALNGVKHIVVYGPSGAGKTSLIECGLRNKFSSADWYALTIRRGNDLNKSLINAIRNSLSNTEGLAEDTLFGEAVERLFAERFRPIYLLFDQFEELLILGEEQEQKDFFERLNQLIQYKVPCRVLLIMREEFIGRLSQYEEQCPHILQHLFRLEKMSRTNVETVITNTLEAKYYKDKFVVQNPSRIGAKILPPLQDSRQEIQLAHVQVFLNRLWLQARQKAPDNSLPVITDDLVDPTDKLHSVLDDFLKKELETFGDDKPIEVLSTMISEHNTKLQVSEADITTQLEKNQVQLECPLEEITQYFKERRIIRTLRADNQIKYEISHDVLADVVGSNRTDKMRLRNEARKAYEFYAKNSIATILTQQQIDNLNEHEKALPFPRHVTALIERSQNYIKEDQQRLKIEKRKKSIVSITSVVFVLTALLTTGLATYFYNNVQEEKGKVKEQTAQLQKQKQKTKEKEKKEILLSDSLKLTLKQVEQQIDSIDDVYVQLRKQVSLTRKEKGLYRSAFKEAQSQKEVAQNTADSLQLEKEAKEQALEREKAQRNNTNKALKQLKIQKENTDRLRAEEQEQSRIANITMTNLKNIFRSQYNLFLDNKEGKYGFLDKNGVLVIDYKYDEALPFDTKYFKAKQGNIEYLIDKQGNEYKFTHKISELTSDIEAFDFSGEQRKFNKDSIRQKILKNKQLKVLFLRNCDISYVPPKISQLQFLETLDLSENDLVSLPPEIGELKNLQTLNLSKNKNLSSLDGIEKLMTLQTLDLSYNETLTSLPAEIRQLQVLQTLNLAYNTKLSSLPTEIGELFFLQILNLEVSNLSSLPAEIGKLESLQDLDLSNNNLSSLPSEIGQLEFLQTLDLKENNLKSLPVEISMLKKSLKVLDLSDNNLSYIPSGIGQLTSLRTLDLSRNNLVSLPSEIGQLESLETLRLTYNDNLSSLPEEIGQLQSLRVLELNYISSLSSLPLGITQLKSLQILDIRNNNLSKLPVGIAQLNNLQTLNLRNNQLSELPADIGQLKQLRDLDLGNVNLIDLPSELGKLYTLNMLERLDLGYNEMSSFPVEIVNLNNLEILILDNNNLTSISGKISRLKNLQILSLKNNKLSSLSTKIGRLQNLQGLYLRGNKFSEKERQKIVKLLPWYKIHF